MRAQSIKIKICGITCPIIASEAVKFGADYIGLVFHKNSKRNIDLSKAKEVALATRKSGAIPVAVFVNQSVDEMLEICKNLNINYVQLHGDLVRKVHVALPDRFTKIFTVNINSNGGVSSSVSANIYENLDFTKDFLLFDGLAAGSGQIIKKDRITEITGNFNYFVAGGLNQANVTHEIANITPFAVDVSTGVENNNGMKDLVLINKFINQVKMGGVNANV